MMTEYAQSQWTRSKEYLRASRHVLSVSADESAASAYYAAFFAVSALFAHRDIYFKKHQAVEAAVHRELVKTGQWTADLGAAYSRLSL